MLDANISCAEIRSTEFEEKPSGVDGSPEPMYTLPKEASSAESHGPSGYVLPRSKPLSMGSLELES